MKVHHDGSLHWIVSRNESIQVFINDSMDRGYQNLKINSQLASLYRRGFPDDLKINTAPIQQQHGGADCGLFATAVCLTLALGVMILLE